MSFCRMTEVKLAQGAKQTGGKLLAAKVSNDISLAETIWQTCWF